MAKLPKTGAGVSNSGRQILGTTRVRDQLADRQLAEYPDDAPPPPQADAQGWRAWAGGAMPVASTCMVEVRLRGGFLLKDGNPLRASAVRFDWERLKKNDDIVAFRIVEE